MNASPSSVRDVLIAARKLIEKPENWCPNGSGDPRKNQHCIVMAVDRCRVGDGDTNQLAINALKNAIGVKRLARWNDAPDRQHTEVLNAFDKAIAECGQ